MKAFQEAIPYYEKGQAKYQELGSEFWVGIINSHLGLVYAQLKNYPKAFALHNKASLNLDKFSDTPEYALEVYANIAESYFLQKNYGLAEDYYQKGVQLGRQMNYKNYVVMYLPKMTKLYEAQQDYKRALAYQKDYTSLHDSIFDETKTRQITEMQTLYETGQKEQQIVEEKQKNELQKAQLEQQRYLTIGAVGALGFMLILALVIYRNQQKQKRLNQELTAQKEEISAQAEELQQTNDKLAELDDFKEQMTSMIAHDIKNPLNTVIAFTDEHSFKKENSRYVKQAGYQVLNLITKQVQVAMEQKSLAIQTDFSQDFILRVDKELIVRVLVNSLSNAIKYSPMNGTISLFHETENQVLKLKIKDEGNSLIKK